MGGTERVICNIADQLKENTIKQLIHLIEYRTDPSSIGGLAARELIRRVKKQEKNNEL